MAQMYQSEVEVYQNNNIVLNIVRASKGLPLSFLDIPSVVGTGSLTETAGFGAFLYSASPGSVTGFFSPTSAAAFSSYSNPSVGFTVGRSFNFTLSSLQNADFEKGFLEKIPLNTVNFFTSDHVSTEVLFTLLVDRFAFIAPDGKKVELINAPYSQNYPEFQTQLRNLIDGGLTTELINTPIKVGPALSASEVANGRIFDQYASLLGKGITLQDASSGGQKQYQLVQALPTVRFCFQQTPYQSKVIEVFGDGMLCANPLNPVKKKVDNKGLNDAKLSPLSISLRSTKEVFQFLGQVAEAQNLPSPIMVNLRKINQGSDLKTKGEWSLIPLLVVKKGSGYGTKSLASVTHGDNEYYIPDSDYGYSIYVINLLSQLLNIIKIPGAIPPSPAVLIK